MGRGIYIVDIQIVDSGLGAVHVKHGPIGIGDHDVLVKVGQHAYQGDGCRIDVGEQSFDLGVVHDICVDDCGEKDNHGRRMIRANPFELNPADALGTSHLSEPDRCQMSKSKYQLKDWTDYEMENIPRRG